MIDSISKWFILSDRARACQKKPKICMHYGYTGPVFQPLTYFDERGWIVRCPICQRKVVAKSYRRAVRRWNKLIRKLERGS